MVTGKVLKIAQKLTLIMISAYCTASASAENYSKKISGYANSTEQSVEALCNEGDKAVESYCRSHHETFRPLGRDVDYGIETEKLANGIRCKPQFLRYDQIVTLMAHVTCRPASSSVAKN